MVKSKEHFRGIIPCPELPPGNGTPASFGSKELIFRSQSTICGFIGRQSNIFIIREPAVMPVLWTFILKTIKINAYGTEISYR